MSSFKDDERLSAKVADFLRKHCPAFRQIKETGVPYGACGAVWHGCKCAAQGADAPCVCVWHLTSTCEFGEWDMPFLAATHAREAKERDAGKAEMAACSDPAFTPKGDLK